jgi:hypothetical protein
MGVFITLVVFNFFDLKKMAILKIVRMVMKSFNPGITRVMLHNFRTEN